MFQTEFEFTLPCGYRRRGRHAAPRGRHAARDRRRRDPAAEGSARAKNPAYLAVILLSRVVTRLGSLAQVNPQGHRELVRIGLRVSAATLQRMKRPRRRGDAHGVSAMPA